ncbi:MAG: flagellar motor switch protein FliM [Planctomycetota bacterium]
MDILDQNEVDALLAAVGSGEVEDETHEVKIFSRHRKDFDEVEVRTYDFKRPERVSKDQMRSLQTLHEQFSRNFGASLSGFLRTIVEVKVATCDQMTYGEFISALPNPTSFNLIESDVLEGQMCMELSPLIIYPIIDRLLGGTSQDLFIPQRPMTLIESRLIGNVTTRGLEALSEAWAGVKEMNFHVTATESNPQLVQIVPPNEVVVVVGFEIKMSNRAGTMSLCIPYNVIEPVMDAVSDQTWFSSGQASRIPGVSTRLNESLSAAPVSAAAVLAYSTMSLQDLSSMAEGDLILTETKSERDVVFCVEGQRKFLARIGQCRDHRAVQIVRPVTPKDRF